MNNIIQAVDMIKRDKPDPDIIGAPVCLVQVDDLGQIRDDVGVCEHYALGKA